METIKKCPKCGKELIIRTNKIKETKFYGCTGFPECKYTSSVKYHDYDEIEHDFWMDVQDEYF